MNAEQPDSPTEGVLGAGFEVSNTLGAGFLEKVYQRALLIGGVSSMVFRFPSVLRRQAWRGRGTQESLGLRIPEHGFREFGGCDQVMP